jgi:hypothetical protein
MPLAGIKDADRARAHLRWAERYSRYDEPHKAAAHFGRALEYDSRSTKSQKFGVVVGVVKDCGPLLSSAPRPLLS